MINKLLKYISDNNLLTTSDKILLAVSGGIDSMVMANLFLAANLKFAIAHCNFNLRGEESDGDQALVENFAKKNNITLHIQAFDTNKFAEDNSISIQMAARELRYNWFNQLKSEHNYTKIATAHNSDDNVETFFLNLLRGTGLNGLTGIEIDNGNIIRPVLFASRKDIKEYSDKNDVKFREDSSNKVNKYARNKIRLDILPDFEKIRPNFKQKMLENIDYLKQVNKFVEAQLNTIQNKYVSIKNDAVYIDTNIVKEESSEFILFELLNKYGFKGRIIKQIAESLNSESGKQFHSETHTITKDRNYLIVTEQNEDNNNEYIINENLDTSELPIDLSVAKIEKDENYKISRDADIAHFDIEKLEFPLVIRKWHKGDSFTPFGMKGSKKVSDFLIDEKIPLNEKKKQWVILSNNKIIWLVGKRIDDKCKITNNTKSILAISLI